MSSQNGYNGGTNNYKNEMAKAAKEMEEQLERADELRNENREREREEEEGQRRRRERDRRESIELNLALSKARDELAKKYNV
jgi:hypothetical protein